MMPAPIVMDCGTGYTKLGFAGNVQPAFVLPTTLSAPDPKQAGGRSSALADLQFSIGEEAAMISRVNNTPLLYPIRHGMVQDWDVMEQFWQQCFFQYLRVNPQDHPCIITEPPLNPPEAREAAAEVMFETFGVSGLFIGVQAVLALYAGWAVAESRSHGQPGVAPALTGAVVDVGEGVTHIIPVVDSYVLGGNIRSIPFGGRDVTTCMQQLLRERGMTVPPDQSAEIARQIKEKHCYVCSDLNKELAKYDAEPSKITRTYTGTNARTGKPLTLSIGPERFLAPELLFTPVGAPGTAALTLSEVVDDVIQTCPIDTRRVLYNNIVVSGGSSVFPNFGRRLQRDVYSLANARLVPGAKALDVSVLSHPFQRHAVWFGGSVLGSADEFPSICHSRADYLEHGPSICRTNHLFRDP